MILQAALATDTPGLFVPFGVFCSKDVYGAVVAGHADQGCILVKVDAESDESTTKKNKKRCYR